MTNEEKAKEIGLTISNRSEAIIIASDCALEMAEWKYKQFKAYLAELKDKYSRDYKVAIANSDDYVAGRAYGRLDAVSEILNEFFRDN